MSRRNPNGYGSVTRLKGHRARPYVVRISVYDEHGNARQKAVGYAETKEKAMLLLAQYHETPWEVDRETITLNDLYQKWLEVKAPELSQGNRNTLKSCFYWLRPCYGMKYRSIKSYHMQKCVDECPRGSSTKSAIRNLFVHLDHFAFEMDIINKMYSQLIVVHSEPPKRQRQTFSETDIKHMWEHADEREMQIVLIYIYTGFRKMELMSMETSQIDLDTQTFTGGEKTTAGKNRIVPIHHRILPFVKNFVDDEQIFFLHHDYGAPYKSLQFRDKIWNPCMEELGLEGRTLHETRHTFETRLDNAGANRKCIDMLMGHVSKDVGNRVYNHKTLKQLKDTIELLK